MAISGDFFEKKREWSKIKDQILGHYLTAYLGKIVRTGRATRVVDCFAGKGRFGDGSPGSPVIICDRIAEALGRSPHADLKAVFIERVHASTLEKNLQSFRGHEVIKGDYEECVRRFLTRPIDSNRNYFFYVDPYGVKSLDFDHFTSLARARLASLELLVNLNTTGFLREGCRLLKLSRQIPEWAANLEADVGEKNTPERMNCVAGGAYWQEILAQFQANRIDFHEAEEKFIEGYVACMRHLFGHVIHIAIRERSHHMPKYRLVFATNHQHGLLLMADEMHAARRELIASEDGNQLYLFDDTVLDSMNGPPILDRILAELSSPLELTELLCRLIEKNGIAFAGSDYKREIRASEGKCLDLTRDPALTPEGRKATAVDEKKYRITVARKKIPHTPLLPL